MKKLLLSTLLFVFTTQHLHAMSRLVQRLNVRVNNNVLFSCANTMRNIHTSAVRFSQPEKPKLLKDALREIEESEELRHLGTAESMVKLEKHRFKSNHKIHNPFISVENLNKSDLQEVAEELLNCHNCKSQAAIKEIRESLAILDVVVGGCSSASDSERKKRFMTLHATRNILKRLSDKYVKKG